MGVRVGSKCRTRIVEKFFVDFGMNKLDVICFDQSEEGIRVASDHAALINSNAKFICDDIRNLDKLKDPVVARIILRK